MNRWLLGLLLALGAAGLFASNSWADEDEDEEIIEHVMKSCFKSGLWKKVAQGAASAEDKVKLLDACKKLASAKPEKGGAASWKERTTALVAAAQAAVDGKANAGDELLAAADCKSCHDIHK